MFGKEMNIQHILIRVKHSKTNGKAKYWFQTYDAKNRQRIEDFDEFA